MRFSVANLLLLGAAFAAPLHEIDRVAKTSQHDSLISRALVPVLPRAFVPPINPIPVKCRVHGASLAPHAAASSCTIGHGTAHRNAAGMRRDNIEEIYLIYVEMLCVRAAIYEAGPDGWSKKDCAGLY